MYGDEKSVSYRKIKNGWIIREFEKDKFEPTETYSEVEPRFSVQTKAPKEVKSVMSRAKSKMLKGRKK